jgi:hypothetical protein
MSLHAVLEAIEFTLQSTRDTPAPNLLCLCQMLSFAAIRQVLPPRRKRKAVLSPEAMAAAVSDDGSVSGGASASDYRGSDAAQPSSASRYQGGRRLTAR